MSRKRGKRRIRTGPRSLPVIRPELDPVPDGCPPDRARCIRIGCAFWSASYVNAHGSIVLGMPQGEGEGVTVPRYRSRRANVNDELLERAADFAVERARAGLGCTLEIVRRNPDGMTRPAIGRVLGGTGEAVRLVEVTALQKLESAIASEDAAPKPKLKKAA